MILQKLFLKLFNFAEWVCHGPVLAVKVIIIFVENDNRRFLLRAVEVKTDCVFCFTELESRGEHLQITFQCQRQKRIFIRISRDYTNDIKNITVRQISQHQDWANDAWTQTSRTLGKANQQS